MNAPNSKRQELLIAELSGYVLERFRDCEREAEIPYAVSSQTLGSDGRSLDSLKICRRTLEIVRGEFPDAVYDKAEGIFKNYPADTRQYPPDPAESRAGSCLMELFFYGGGVALIVVVAFAILLLFH